MVDVTGILGRAAASAARQLNLKLTWQAHQVEMENEVSYKKP